MCGKDQSAMEYLRRLHSIERGAIRRLGHESLDIHTLDGILHWHGGGRCAGRRHSAQTLGDDRLCHQRSCSVMNRHDLAIVG